MQKINENKLIKIFIILIIILIFILIIYFIWSPTFSKLSSDGINKYEDKNYEEEIKKYYTNYFKENLKITNFDNLFSNIDEDYLNDINIFEKNDVKEYLKENNYISMNINIQNIEIYDRDFGEKVLIVTYTTNGNERYIYIYETIPYKFKISFFRDMELNEGMLSFDKSKIVDDVEYDIDVLQTSSTNITLKINIINNSNNILKYDFSYLDSIQLVYDSEKTINIAAIANSNSSNFELTPKSSNSIEVTFNLPWSNQITISNIRINNIEMNGQKYNVEI